MEVHGYTQTGSIDATIDGVRITVPDDMGNRHRQMISEWEEAGNTIPTFAQPVETPLAQPLDRLDFWLAAAEVGVSKWSVRDTIAALPEDTPEAFKNKAEVIAWFEEAERYRREDPILIAMAAAQGINEEQLDALWVWAVPEQT